MLRQSPFFYGWIIVAIAVVAQTLVYGIRHSFSVFFPSILDEFGWTRGSTSIILSLNILVYGFAAPLAGSLADRWKPKMVMVIGVSILGLATAASAFATELWHFYLLVGVLMSLGGAFCAWPILAPAVTNWFLEKRGLALGISGIGGGLSFVYGVFVEFVISRLGWRPAYAVLAGVLVIILVPIYLFLFVYRPENMGQRAYGADNVSTDGKAKLKTVAAEPEKRRDWTLSEAIRTYQLWFLVLSYALYWGLANYMVLGHQVRFVEDVGYSSLFAASIFAMFGVFMSIGMLSGAISDWIGREKTITLAAILAIVALLALSSVSDTSQPWLLYIYAVCLGGSAGLYTPTAVASTADLFHGRHFGAIAGMMLAGMGVGGAIGPWLGGYIYDVTGSYTIAFILAMVCYGISCIAVWIAAPRNAAKLRAGV